ncbi:MAG TPA: VWA domain-containing protein, partial [Anaerolineae bacterium]|nr:VWA domain-containing protein [Anaerolineae bacterium]
AKVTVVAILLITLITPVVSFGATGARPIAIDNRAPGVANQAPDYHTLRVYGRDNWGAGDPTAADPVTGNRPEAPPYRDQSSIFDPAGRQAPVKDFITWNPAWMYEAETFDELQASGLYGRIHASGINAAEKVWFRTWYEPKHWDKDLDADGAVDDSDVVYPAIMQEFTYQLVEADFLANEPKPTVGTEGSTSIVFPVGMRWWDMYDSFGYGLTSLDADFDGSPDIVNVDSELSFAGRTGITFTDFDGDGVMDVLDSDGMPLSGDELVVLSVDPVDLPVGGSIQFLDHVIRIESVSDAGANVRIWYTGDLEPANMGTQSIALGDLWLYGTRLPGTQAPNPGIVPAGPFFVQVTSVDTTAETAQLRVGRALGAAHTAMESSAGQPDLLPGDPWWLKRFYVDGHEYNVVAIGTQDHIRFGYITLRTPVPKEPVIIHQHSVQLQDYAALAWLSVLPPFNYEHYILGDVNAITAFDQAEADVAYLGKLIGPVPPILQQNGPFPYWGVGPNSPYFRPREMFFYYVAEAENPQFLGELKEKYGEQPMDVILALDTSSSVEPVFPGEQSAAKELVDLLALDPNNRFGVVSFATNATLEIGLNDDPVATKAVIDGLTPGGLTNLEEAVNVSQTELSTNGRPNAIPIIILFSNGGATAGGDPVAAATAAKAAGTVIATVGVGDTPDAVTLQAMASPGLYFKLNDLPSIGIVLGAVARYGGHEFWYDEQWWTVPYRYTEFVLPDIRDAITGASTPDRYLLTSAFWAPQSEHRLWTQDNPDPVDSVGERVNFWFDPATGGKKYKDDNGLRVYGREHEGAGDPQVTDPQNPGYPVEVLPYTDPWAPFNPQLPQAPVKDSITFNPAYLSEFNNTGEPLADLYGQIAIEGRDAREKVYTRLWYEPAYLDKILQINPSLVYTFPAVMQEFTYMLLDTADQPAHGQPGNTSIAFPMATGAGELPRPDPATGELNPADLPSFGYGLTSFDANFDGMDDIVRVHSERSLLGATGIFADFDGDTLVDPLDPDGLMNGNEMVVLAVENIELHPGQSAQFLDHMVTLENVTVSGGPQAQLQIWYAGGGLHALGGGMYSLHPDKVGAPVAYAEGEMGIVGRDRVNVRHIPRLGTNIGSLDGPWFVYVSAINSTTETAVVTIGRALGATHSAIDDGGGLHDMLSGDPWYLKRFFVDGHEYNVVAIRTAPADSPGEDFEFKYLTLRTPVPKETFVNTEDSQVLQGYYLGDMLGVDSDVLSVMPPFNVAHTVAEDIVARTADEFADPDFYDEDCAGLDADVLARPPLVIRVVDEDVEPQFFGELREIRLSPSLLWQTRQFHTIPGRYTDLQLPSGELYLLTSDWESDQSRLHFYACVARANGQDWLAARHPGIPPTNVSDEAAYFDAAEPNDFGRVRVKFWYDPTDPEDIYVNRWTPPSITRDYSLRENWNLWSTDLMPDDPAVAEALDGIRDMLWLAMGFQCGVGGLSYYPTLPPALNSLGAIDPYHGFWLKTTEAATLSITGLEIPEQSPIYLCPGWNLVSYLPDAPMPVATALTSIDGLYTVVLGYDGGGLSYYPDLPPGLNTLTQLEPGHGYWIKMTEPGTLIYPSTTLARVQPQVAAPIGAGVTPTNRWMDFYGMNTLLNGKPVPEGAVVTAFDPNGVKVGEFVVRQAGWYGVMPIYGDDPETSVDEGAQPGDVITFYINGQRAAPLGPGQARWIGDKERQELNLITSSYQRYLPLGLSK